MQQGRTRSSSLRARMQSFAPSTSTCPRARPRSASSRSRSRPSSTSPALLPPGSFSMPHRSRRADAGRRPDDREPVRARSAHTPGRLHREVRRADIVADGRGGGRTAVSTPIVIDCDPGHDDAIAILLALASPEVELRGITTVAGNQTLEKTTRNALKVLELAGRTDIPVAAGAAGPLRRALRTAANVHGESGLEGPDLPEPKAQQVAADAADLLAVLIEPG